MRMQDHIIHEEKFTDKTIRLGIDIGTTAIKCVLLNHRQLLASSNVSMPKTLQSKYDTNVESTAEMDVLDIIITLHKALTELPANIIATVQSIGICGQMHGIVWWQAASVCQAMKLYVNKRIDKQVQSIEINSNSEQVPWSRLVTWEDKRIQMDTLQEWEKEILQIIKTTNTKSSPLSSGYGIATFSHIQTNYPNMLDTLDTCGTIQDFVTFLLCGFTQTKDATMDYTNASSWGGFDQQTKTWNSNVVQALQVPLHMLPNVIRSGEIVGHIREDTVLSLLPAGCIVHVAMGDHPCSVLAAMLQQETQDGNFIANDMTLINIGTSAQLAIVRDASLLESCMESSSKCFEWRPFLSDSQVLGVAASLSGGNIFAQFVQQCQDWYEQLSFGTKSTADQESSVNKYQADWYSRIIQLGMEKIDTKLQIDPTFNGERHNPGAKATIQHLTMSNWTIGDISASLCKGLIENLFQMVPKSLQPSLQSQPIIGTGNALLQNKLLEHYLRHHLKNSNELNLLHAIDAAMGAACIQDISHI